MTATHQNLKTGQMIQVVGENTNSKGAGVLYRAVKDGATHGATQRTSVETFAKKFAAI